MCATWHKTAGFDPAILLSDVASSTRVEGDKVSFSGWDFEELLGILCEQMGFHPDVSEVERPGLFWKALVNAARKKRLTRDGVEEALAQIEKEYLQRPIVRFILISNLSLDRDTVPEDLEFNQCRLRYFGHQQKMPSFDRSPIESMIERQFEDRKLPTNYTSFFVEVSGRTPRAAAEKAFEVAALSRATINLWENRRVLSRISWGTSRCVNDVLPGPISTIHHLDGTLASEEFWYDSSYSSPQKPHRIRKLNEFLKENDGLFHRLGEHPYPDVLKDALLRYNAALDKNDFDASIVQLWSVLERLTGTDSNRYNDLVRQTAFLYKDHARARAVLSHLRNYRNAYIHSNQSSAHRNDAVHVARRFVQDLLYFHWHNTIKATTFGEACEFLQSEPDVAKLKRKTQLLELAAQFMGSGISQDEPDQAEPKEN